MDSGYTEGQEETEQRLRTKDSQQENDHHLEVGKVLQAAMSSAKAGVESFSTTAEPHKATSPGIESNTLCAESTLILEEKNAPKPTDPVLQELIRRQTYHFPGVLKELEARRKKTGHWAWWAWPTDKEGFSEPLPQTRVSFETAPALLRVAEETRWREVLEKVCALVEANGRKLDGVVPRIDHGRIIFFVKFWNTVPEKPPWMAKVLQTLESSLPGPQDKSCSIY